MFFLSSMAFTKGHELNAIQSKTPKSIAFVVLGVVQNQDLDMGEFS